jgi:monoamine oxidase
MFDQAFSESVVDWYDFPSDANWYRVENGMTAVIEALCAHIETQPTLNTEVKSIAMDPNNKVDVKFRDASGRIQTRKYKAVFSSTSLGALQRIQLQGLGSRTQIDAIRNLAYDTSCKVGIKFKTAWWINKGKMTPKGGVSTSDLAIRSVAYPPWTDTDDPNLPTIIIASYTWHQDAMRLGSLINNSYSPPTEKPEKSRIIQLVLENLVQIFQHPEITYEFLMLQLIDYHPWAWHNDPYCAGAYALFGPAQFSTLYPSLFSPLEGSDNNVFLMGEHASAHHAWLSGAFASAEASFYTYFAPERVPPKTLQHTIAKKVRAELPKKALGQIPIGNGKAPSGLGGPVQGAGSVEEGIMSGLLGEVEDEVLYWMAQLAKQKPTDPLFDRL